MNKKKIIGATLAAAAALTFTAAPISSAIAASSSDSIQCFGINSCKGQGACKSTSNACKGQNSCKGKGVVMEPTEQACTDAGGSLTQ